VKVQEEEGRTGAVLKLGKEQWERTINEKREKYTVSERWDIPVTEELIFTFPLKGLLSSWTFNCNPANCLLNKMGDNLEEI
jgi:hypothetical protein